MTSELMARMRKRHAVPDGERTAFKRGSIAAPSVDHDKREVGGMVTTTDVGIDGMIVPASAFDTSYFWEDDAGRKGVRAVYYGHDYDALPIGKCVTLTPKGDGLWVRTYITRTGIGDALLTLIDEGIVNGLSAGMRVTESSAPTEHERTVWRVADSDAEVVRKALLLEYSVVSMPACGTAQLDNLLCRGAVTREAAAYFGLPISPARRFWPTGGLVIETGPIIIET